MTEPMRDLSDMIRDAHDTARAKGWWDKERNLGEQIALMHSELSEALEEWRVHGYTPELMLRKGQGVRCDTDISEDGWCHKPEGIAAEFADVLIRIFDTCAKYEIPLVEALNAKLAYNKTRPYRHGGKLA